MRLLFAISFNSFSDRFIILILFAKKKKKITMASPGMAASKMAAS